MTTLFHTILQATAQGDVNHWRDAALSDDRAVLSETERDRLTQALAAAAHVVHADPTQLAGQLLARLHASDGPTIAHLLTEASAWRDATWLAPQEPSLARLTTPLVRTLAAERTINRLSVVLDARGQLALVSNIGALEVWDIDQPRRLTLLTQGIGTNALALSGDRRIAATLASHAVLQCWDFPSMTVRAGVDIVPRSSNSGTVALSPSGAYALVSDGEEALKLYDTASGALVQVFAGHADIDDFAAHLRRWRARSPDHPAPSAPPYTALAFTPDGDRVVSATTNGTLSLWDVRTGARIRTWAGTPPMTTKVVCLPDNRRVLAATASGMLVLWSLDTPAVLGAVQAHAPASRSHAPTPEWISTLAISDDGQTVVTIAGEPIISVWSLDGNTLRLRGTLASPCTMSYGAALDARGRRLVTTGNDNTVRVWDLQRLPPPHVLAQAVPTLRLAAIATRGVVAVPDLTPTQVVMHVDAGGDPRMLGRHRAPITALRCAHDQGWCASGDEAGHIRLWGPDGAALGKALRSDGVVAGLAWSDNGQRLLSWGDSAVITLWDVVRRRMLAQCQGWGDYVTTAAMNTDGGRVVFVIDGYVLRVWDTSSQQDQHVAEYYDSPITLVRLLPGSAVALVGAENGDILLWNLANGVLQAVMTGHSGPLSDLVIAVDGQHAVSVGEDGTLRVWDLVQGVERARFTADASLLTVRFDDDNDVISVDRLGQVHRLRLVHPETTPVAL